MWSLGAAAVRCRSRGVRNNVWALYAHGENAGLAGYLVSWIACQTEQ